MTEEDLERIIIRIGDEKPNLRIRGGERLHPIYEAVLALLRQHLTDEQIMKRMKDESDLNKIIAIDSMIDSLPEEKRQEFTRKIDSIDDYKKILDLASLYIAENRRIQDGTALNPVSDSEMPKYVLRAIKKASPEDIFVNEQIISGLEERAKKIRKRRIGKTITAAVLSVAVAAGAYFNREAIIENVNLIYDRENLKSEINHLKNDYSKLEAEVEQEIGFKLKGYQMYKMLPDEFNKQEQPSVISRKIESIQKEGSINQVSFIYDKGNICMVKFFYNKK